VPIPFVKIVELVLRKIDIHTHIIPPKLPNFKDRFGYGGFIQLEHHRPCGARMIRDDGKFFREIESNCWDPHVRLDDMGKAGIDVQVLSTVPVMFSYWAKATHANDLARFLNDHIAQVIQENPGKFIGLGTLPLQSPDLAIQELHRCMTQLNFSGVQIGSHVNDFNLNEPSLFPVFQAAAELGASIFIHPWDMMGQNQMQKYWLPWLVGMPAEISLAICSMIFGGIFERLPTLKVAFAHGGGAFPGTLGRIEHGFHARPDLCAIDNPFQPSHYLGKFFVDSLVHDLRTLHFILDTFGENSVALGTDYPFPLGDNSLGYAIERNSSLSNTTKLRLLKGSALAWLGKTENTLFS